MRPNIKWNIPSILSFCVICLAIGLKLWIGSGKFFQANITSQHDDGLYFKIAQSISKGDWLGQDNNNKTLLRGVGYPLWIAFVAKTRLPLGIAQDIAYVISCFVIFLSLRGIIKSHFLSTVLFLILLFDPTYCDWLFVYKFSRHELNLPVAFIVAGSTIGIMTNVEHRGRLFFWCLLCGLSTGYFSLIRGEAVWMLPLTFFTFLFLLVKVITHFRDSKISDMQKFFFSISAGVFLLTLFIPTTLVLRLNQSKYGVSITDELSSREMKDAYSSLVRIKPTVWLPHVPVQTETRIKLYNLSPLFLELKNSFEGDNGHNWLGNSQEETRYDPSFLASEQEEITGGWFIFAFRDAVAEAGYYPNVKTALNFYSRLSKEVDHLCDTKQLECYPKFMTKNYLPPLRLEYIPLISRAIFQSVDLITTVPFYIDTSIFHSYSTPEDIIAVQQLLSDRNIAPIDRDISLVDYPQVLQKIRLSNHITRIIDLFFRPLLIGGTVIFLYRFINSVRRRCFQPLLLFQLSVLLSTLALILIISLVQSTSFPAIAMIYLLPAHSFLLLFALCSFVQFRTMSES